MDASLASCTTESTALNPEALICLELPLTMRPLTLDSTSSAWALALRKIWACFSCSIREMWSQELRLSTGDCCNKGVVRVERRCGRRACVGILWQ